MPSFPRPSFAFSYNSDVEILRLRDYRDTKPGRAIPDKRDDRVLIATWNIANLGLQKRRDDDYRILAEMVSWFDIIALQEVNDNLAGLRAIQSFLLGDYQTMFSDRSGNNERMAFLYDADKIEPLEKFGEIAIPVAKQKYIKLPGITRAFSGFDRNPFIGSFKSGSWHFLLVNAHLYYGKDKPADRQRRSLEAYATSRWGDLRRNDKDAYCTNIVVLGDFNLPLVVPGDPIYEALRRRGLRRPDHSTKIHSNIANDKDYDQILFFPGPVKQAFSGKIGIFDFDTAVFPLLFETRSRGQHRAYLRYYLSDHRPMWAEFKTRA